RRGDLHRRPFLHQALRLPLADRQAQSRSVAQRSGRNRDRELCRLRAVRRGRPCGGAVPFVLSRRGDPQSELAGARAAPAASSRHRLLRRARRGSCMRSTTRPITILIAALGGEGGGVLTDWIVAAAAQLGFPVQSTSIPGVAQRTGATTYYIELVPLARQA